jgi:hypothetical protein
MTIPCPGELAADKSNRSGGAEAHEFAEDQQVIQVIVAIPSKRTIWP